ncbi:hypothetical protein B0T10DRAFT_436452, partial [Thelonectria olida]
MAEGSIQSRPGTLETLPSLINDEICQYLVNECRNGLSSFALVSTRCAVASARFRLRCIHLRLSQKEKLLQDLDWLSHALGPGGQHSNYIRQLKLTGGMVGSERDNYSRGRLSPTKCEQSIHDFIKQPLDFVDFPYCDIFALTPNEQEKRQIEEAWSPLSRFISQLSLTDLVYACSHQIPRCLLDALHQNSSQTRLHIHTFSLRSLYQPPGVFHDIDPDEYMLVTSPSLYSIAGKSYHFGTAGRLGYNYEALEAMVAGLAPNLTHFSLLPCPTDATLHDLGVARRPKPPWRGFFGEGIQSSSTSKSRLQTLACHPRTIRNWLSKVHSDQLASFQLYGPVSLKELKVLVETAQTTGFQRLSSWRLTLSPSSYGEEEAREMDFQAGMLLRSLSPLDSLDLDGAFAKGVLDALLDYHGNSLQKLRLGRNISLDLEPWDLSLDDFRNLAAKCPKLEQLEIGIRRAGQLGGGWQEIETYRALGQFPRLKHLKLTLDCAEADPIEPGDDDDCCKASAPVFWNALVRCAIDSYLAREIFQLIRSSQSSLEYLGVRVVRSGYLGEDWQDSDAEEVLSWISPSWVCEQKDGAVLVSEVKGSRVGDGDLLKVDFGGRGDLRRVWTALWPGTGDRRESWSSFPLA